MREDVPAGDWSLLVVVVLLAFVPAFVDVFVVGFIIAFVVAIFFTAFVTYALAGLSRGPVFGSFLGARNWLDWGGSNVCA